jgi:hypothetical protein
VHFPENERFFCNSQFQVYTDYQHHKNRLHTQRKISRQPQFTTNLPKWPASLKGINNVKGNADTRNPQVGDSEIHNITIIDRP